MSKLKTGLTARTVESFQLNAGVLLSAYTKGGEISEDNIIGATRGGGSFTAVPEIHQAAVDGAPTYTKGLERCDGWTATLNMTLVEFTAPAVRTALGVGSVETATGTPADTVISAVTKVLSTDYKDVYWVGDLSDGRNAIIHLKNALNTGGLNLTFADKGEGTFTLALIAHYDISDIDTAPFTITIEGKEAVA